MYIFFKSPAVGVIKAQLKRRSTAAQQKPTKEQELNELRKEAQPFGIPDEDIVIADVNEAIEEIKELKERQAMGESPFQAFKDIKAKRQ